MDDPSPHNGVDDIAPVAMSDETVQPAPSKPTQKNSQFYPKFHAGRFCLALIVIIIGGTLGE
ncbi:hypothetical protein G9A89_014728 [Geosiphon pyriformis]|nr:hypothetical protein G9A89_014728 [Geosiphon pyriformis]